MRLDDAARPALHRLAVGLRRIRDGERDVLDAVAVPGDVLRDLRRLPKRARQHEPDLALAEHVGGAVAHARLGSGVGDPLEAECVLVPVGGLLRVSDPELDVIPTVERHVVGRHVASIMRLERRLVQGDRVRERILSRL